MHRTSKRYIFRAGLVLIATFLFLISAYGQGTGGVKGTVRNMRGEAVPRAAITARQNRTDLKTVTANDKGYFVLDGLESGRYDFAFDAVGYGLGVLYNVEVKKGKIRDLGGRLMLATDRGSQIFVRGVIFYKDNTSIYGAKVELFAVSADGSTRRLVTGFTNELGEFGFVQPQGAKKFRVRASFKGVTGEKDIQIDMPAVYRLSISLDISRDQN